MCGLPKPPNLATPPSVFPTGLSREGWGSFLDEKKHERMQEHEAARAAAWRARYQGLSPRQVEIHNELADANNARLMNPEPPIREPRPVPTLTVALEDFIPDLPCKGKNLEGKRFCNHKDGDGHCTADGCPLERKQFSVMVSLAVTILMVLGVACGAYVFYKFWEVV